MEAQHADRSVELANLDPGAVMGSRARRAARRRLEPRDQLAPGAYELAAQLLGRGRAREVKHGGGGREHGAERRLMVESMSAHAGAQFTARASAEIPRCRRVGVHGCPAWPGPGRSRPIIGYARRT